MLKKVGAALLMMVAWQSQAAYECNIKPQDDIFITKQQVKIIGASGDLIITPAGEVSRNGNSLTLTNEAKERAQAYQSALRRDLPYIDTGVRQRLSTAQKSLDSIIVKQLGSESKVRNRLSTLHNQLDAQMSRVITTDSGDIAFHHQAIDQVSKDGEQLVQQAMGGVLQDSINELGVKQVGGSSGNPLQALLGNLGGLQQDIQTEWKKQENDFQTFGKEACDRVTVLEQQRTQLLAALPQ